MFALYSNFYLQKSYPLVSSLVLILLLFTQTIKANKLDYRYKKAFDIQKLSLEEGLSQSVINQIVQDNNGFIWLATEDGLNRFDGYDFLVYQHDHKKPLSLHENWVVSLAINPNKGLWVGTVAGLSYMDFASKNFTNYGATYPKLSGIVRDLLYIKDNGIWVANNKGLFFQSKDKARHAPFEKIKLFESNDFNYQAISLAFNDEILYAATNHCIFQVNRENNISLNLCDTLPLSILRGKEITKILLDKDELWIATTSGLFLFDVQAKTLKAFYEDSENGQSISSNYVQDLVVDSNNSIWVSTINGVSIYNKKTHKFISHKQVGFGKKQLSSSDIISSFIDIDGLVWLGTYGRGVNVLNPNQQRFDNLFTQQDAVELGSVNTVHGVEKDQYENLWLASYGGGLVHYNLMTGETYKPVNEQGITYDEYVFSLKIDKTNTLWVGTYSEILLIDLETKNAIQTEIYIDDEKINKPLNVSKFFEDHSGNLWLLSELGLYKNIADNENIDFDKKIQKLQLEDWTGKLPFSYKQKTSSLNSMVEDKNGNFWIGGDAGLLFYNRTTDDWQHFTYDALLPNSISSNSIQTIYIDNQGFVWVGTADGLNRVIEIKSFKQDVYQFDRITTYEGLPSNTIYGIQQDNNSGIWLSTSKGIVKFNKNALKMDLFRNTDGLSSDEFNLGGTFVDEDDRVYFSSINGITSITDPNTRKITKNSNLRFVKIKIGSDTLDSFILNTEHSMPIKSIEYGTAIEIWLSAMTYSKFGVSRYRYRIKGLDDKWVNLGGNRKLFIAGLATGSYRIEIQSRDPGEPWSSNSLFLPVKISTDFFKSKMFIFMAILLLSFIFLIVLIIIANTYRKKLASEKNKLMLEKLRVKELKVDNDGLVYAVSERDRKISKLSSEMEITTNKVDVERYRDISTGFYRFDFVLDLQIKELQNKVSALKIKQAGSTSDKPKTIKNYTLAAVIEFIDYDNIVKNYGFLEAKDFISQVSIELRRETNADTQFYTLSDGTYILFNASHSKKKVIDGLLKLCSSFNNSSYEIANGRSVTCKTKITYVELDNLQINNQQELIKVKRLIQKAHDRAVPQKLNKKHSISKELKILRILSCESLTDDFDFNVLIEDGTLQINV
ncbi:MAG: ligand-binding sensor domain-containing protein [Polaribacter sp.]|jgi:ligand-binding sensor domain-containing protein